MTRASPADTAAFTALRPADQASPQSLRALDWFSFFVADIQAGFGPFIAAYLTAQAWSQGHIGIALTVGSMDVPQAVRPTHHYGVEARLPWVDIGRELPAKVTRERW